MAQEDVDCDGVPATLGDPVGMTGHGYDGTFPNYCAGTVVGRLTYGNSVLSTDTEGGAAQIVVQGDVSPQLLSSTMRMRHEFDGTNTNILIYSLGGDSFIGDILRCTGIIVSVEISSPNGERLVTKPMPNNFVLHQNYPNMVDFPHKAACETPVGRLLLHTCPLGAAGLLPNAGR